MRVLRDPSLQSLHVKAVNVLTDILFNLGQKAVPYLDKVLSPEPICAQGNPCAVLSGGTCKPELPAFLVNLGALSSVQPPQQWMPVVCRPSRMPHH